MAMRKTIHRSFFEEYNIPSDPPKKKRKKPLKLRSKNVSYHFDADYTIENFSEDESPLPLSFIKVKRTSLPLVFSSHKPVCGSPNNIVGNSCPLGLRVIHSLQEDDDSDEGTMPRPIIIKEEPSEQIQLSWHSSPISSIATTASNILESVPASENDLISPFFNRSRKYPQSPVRFEPLEISLNKKESPRRSPRLALIKRTPKKSCRQNLNSSWLSSNEEPFEGFSSPENKSYLQTPKRFEPLQISVNKKTSPRRSPRIALMKKTPKKPCHKNLNYEEPFEEFSSPENNSYLETPKRFKPLEISVQKKTSPRRSPRVALMQKSQKKPCCKNLNCSWLSANEEQIEGFLSPGNQPNGCSSPKAIQIIQTPPTNTSPRKTPIKPLELELLNELMVKENEAKVASLKKFPRKSSKRPLPGGLEEMFNRCMLKAENDSKFLKHDKKYGLLKGVVLRVLELECSYGVHLAKVQRVEGRDKNVYGIVIPDKFIPQLKPNSKIEAFFDETTESYKLPDRIDGTFLEVYINPHKLLIP